VIYGTKFIFKTTCCVSYSAFDPLAPSLTLALMWRPDDAVGSLPGLVIVERGTALAVLTGRVVSADTPAVDLAGKETHLHHHIHMLLSICVCVCVCG